MNAGRVQRELLDLAAAASSDPASVAVQFLSGGMVGEVRWGEEAAQVAAEAYVAVVAAGGQPGLLMTIAFGDGVDLGAINARLDRLRPRGRDVADELRAEDASGHELDLPSRRTRSALGRPLRGASTLRLVSYAVPRDYRASLLVALAAELGEATGGVRSPRAADRVLAAALAASRPGARQTSPDNEGKRAGEPTPPGAPSSEIIRGGGAALDDEAAIDAELALVETLLARAERSAGGRRAPSENAEAMASEALRRLTELVEPNVEQASPEQEARARHLRDALARLMELQREQVRRRPVDQAFALATVLFLAPTLVAGLYGTNVGLPLEGTPQGVMVVLALTLGVSVVAGSVIAGLEYDGRGRAPSMWRIPPTMPDEKIKDGATVVLLTAAVLSVVINLRALSAIGEVTPDAGTTRLTVIGLALLCAYVALYELASEGLRLWRMRPLTASRFRQIGRAGLVLGAVIVVRVVIPAALLVLFLAA